MISSPFGGAKGADGRCGGMTHPSNTPADPACNRDQEQRPDAPDRATEPAGAEGAARSSKTATDPASGETHGSPPRPNQAEMDVTDGAAARSR